MKRSVIVGAVCAVGLLVGIGVWAWKSSTNTVKTEFTQSDFLEDYQQLWADLQENYPFLPVLEELGVDVEGIRKSGEDTLKQREITLDGFVWLLKQQFGQMRGLAHLGVVDANTLNVYAQAAETGELTDVWYDITHNPQTVATYERLQQTADGQSTNTEGGSQDLPQVETRYYPEEKAVYFHFPTFDISTVERDAHVVEDYLDSLGDVDIQHVILDITGNTGGSTDYWKNNIAKPLGGSWEWSQTVYLGDTPVNQQFVFSKVHPIPISELEQKELPEFVSNLDMTYGFTFTMQSDAPERLEGVQRWLLIDGQVFSASDNFATFCQDTGWATLVGTTTRGDGGSGQNPVMISLPNTGLLVRFSSTATANAQGQLNVAYGTNPDVTSSQKEAPLDTVLEQIRNS